MKIFWKPALVKSAVAALALAGASLAMTGASAAQSFGIQVGPRGGIGFSYDSGGYCDPRGCPEDFWNLPVYYGPVFYDGRWFDGPVYYRNWYGRRQYWIYGGWRNDQWRGPRPGWYREGRLGPPLGMNYYRDNGFHGRWDNDRNSYRRDEYRRDEYRRDEYRRDDDRRNLDRRDDHRGPDANGFRQGRGAPQNATPAAPAPAPAPQAAPQPPPAPPANGQGRRDHDGPRPDRPQGSH